MKTTNLKSITAVKFRLVLIVLMSFVVILMIGLFFFGYRYMQSVSQETAKRQADASASEDSIGTLKRLQVQLKTLDGLSEKLSTLRSSDTLPQFETERSLRAITAQLGLGIRDVEFIDSSAATGSTDSATPAATSTDRSSKISFQFNRPLTYDELVHFLDAIETSIPKLTLQGVTIPTGSTRSSIELGTLTLEMATN
ncbi:MAG TPA: hypothetical protein PKD28_00730 [Candidatus Saccharibacteria bacterium]|nr:hypothetical protein [Candidatus Saccharibacteria bacterium]